MCGLCGGEKLEMQTTTVLLRYFLKHPAEAYFGQHLSFIIILGFAI